MATPSEVTVVDGTLDFSGGVNSVRVTTVASDNNAGGLKRNELAWAINCTMRDGGITQRWGWKPLGVIYGDPGLYQGGFMYEPENANPYLIVSVGGYLIAIDPENPETPQRLTDIENLRNPPDERQSFFCQAENYLIVQAGDGKTLPLFWDGNTLRRSIGITTSTPPGIQPGINEIPAATCMDYYMGRLWFAQGRRYAAGDIVGGTSGTEANRYRDAVLNVTEAPLCFGGDGFAVPTNDGNIRAIKHSANLDASLGQGRLFIGTRRAIYSLNVPVNRDEWIMVDANNQPMQVVVQLVNGFVNDRSVVSVNGDLFYQSLEPGIRSLMQAIRFFEQWGNIDISSNVRRVLQFNDRSLLWAASGICFDNRMLQSALPRQTERGVVHDALIALDFVPMSSFGGLKIPNWEGVHEGLQFLQLFTADFGGRERAFAVVESREDQSIQLWELTNWSETERGDNRVSWLVEFPAFTWGDEFRLKRLVSAELWVDRLRGTVEFTAEYRPDGWSCWIPWHQWKACSPRNSAENMYDPVTYPLEPYGHSYRTTMVLPRPMDECRTESMRPSTVGYQFQVRLKVKGYCRIRGLMLHAEWRDRQLYENKVC